MEDYDNPDPREIMEALASQVSAAQEMANNPQDEGAVITIVSMPLLHLYMSFLQPSEYQNKPNIFGSFPLACNRNDFFSMSVPLSVWNRMHGGEQPNQK